MFSWTAKRSYYAAVSVEHELYAFGGFSDGDRTTHFDVNVFNTVSLHWVKLPLVTTGRGERLFEVPSSLLGHTAVLIEDIVYLWGGYEFDTKRLRNVLFAFDVDAHRWFKPIVSGTVPEARENHSACVLGKVMFIHGGDTKLTEWTNDIYKLDTTTMLWSLINTRGTPPPASYCHSDTIIGTKMFVFGGWAKGQYYNTIRVFDTETNTWLTTPSAQPHPVGRRSHSAFTYNGDLYIFGGCNINQSQTFNDLWKFNPETFTWKKVELKGKLPNGMYTMCCCMVGDCAFLFGAHNAPNDLYILDFSPSLNLKTLCKLAVIQYDLDQSELPHNIRWELAAMTTHRHATVKNK